MEISLNLLPWRISLLQKKKRFFILRAVCYGLLCCGLMIATHLLLITQINQLKNKNQILLNDAKNIIVLDPLKSNEKLFSQLKKLFPLKSQSIKHNQAMTLLLVTLVSDLPNTVTLTQLSLSLKNILLMGESLQLPDIHQYSVALQNIQWPHNQLFDVHHDSSNFAQIHFSIRLSHENT